MSTDCLNDLISILKNLDLAIFLYLSSYTLKKAWGEIHKTIHCFLLNSGMPLIYVSSLLLHKFLTFLFVVFTFFQFY